MKKLISAVMFLTVITYVSLSQVNGPWVDGVVWLEVWDNPGHYTQNWNVFNPQVKAGPYASDIYMGACGSTSANNWGVYQFLSNYCYINYQLLPPAYLKANGTNYIWSVSEDGTHPLKSDIYPIPQGVTNAWIEPDCKYYNAPFRGVVKNNFYDGSGYHSEGFGNVKVDNVLYEGTYVTPVGGYDHPWYPGQTHTIEALTPQYNDYVHERYDFVNWSDNGARLHQIQPTAGWGEYRLYYTANFVITYLPYITRVYSETGNTTPSKGPATGLTIKWTIGDKHTYPVYYVLEKSYPVGSAFHQIYMDDKPYYFDASAPLSSDINYRVKVWDSHGNYGGSVTYSYKASVPGDPIVATTQSPEATSYSNGRKIVIDDTGTLHVTYTSGDTVYHTSSSDDGETWTPSQAVALGQNPALALKADGTPLLCWNQGSNVYTTEKSGSGWAESQLVYSGSPGEDISYLSFAADPATGKTYSGWVSTAESQSQVLVAERTPGNPIQPAPERIDFGTVAFKSPSLAIKKDGSLITAWSKDGVVRYREGSGAIIELSSPDRHCIHPIVEAYGDRVTVVWQESEAAKGTSTSSRLRSMNTLGDHLEPGRYRIVSRTRNEYGWGEERVIASSEAGDYQYPVAAAAGQYLYAGHHGDDNHDIHYLGDYVNGWETHSRNISLNSEGQSGYP